MMSSVLIGSAAAFSFLWLVIHAFVGGRQVATPLMADQTLPEVVRVTAVMCWHMTTATLLVMTILFAIALFGEASYAIAGSLLAAAIAVAGIVAAPLQGVGWRILPQGWLFVPPSLLGLAGAFTG